MSSRELNSAYQHPAKMALFDVLKYVSVDITDF